MLDQLQMATRRYEQIAPNPGAEMTQPQADQLIDWLNLEVGEIVESLLSRPGFRRRVRWPIERLTGELDCPEREAVLAVDNSLIHCAKALSTCARRDEVWRQLLRLGPYQSEVQEGDPSALDTQLENENLPPTPLGLRQVEFLVKRPWKDLASAWDYFHPVSHFNFNESEDTQRAEFMPFLNNRLRVPGDFIARCMDLRVETWHSDLQKFRVRCDIARRSAGINAHPQWDKLNKAFSELSSQINALRALCYQGQEAQVRDSCIALIQIYAGFHQGANLSWLGQVSKLAVNADDFPDRVLRRHQWEIPERGAAALIDIANLVRRPQPPEDLIEEMKSIKRLVLIEEQREGFLDGVSINKDNSTNWHGPGNLFWELLWTLADRALLRRVVDRDCLSNPKAREAREPPSCQAVKDRRSELKQLIVPELNKLIVDAGRSTYCLKLKPDEICLLGWFNDEQLVVLEPLEPRP